MRIIKLTLHKYDRISLSGLETLVYTPEASAQIIIGSNGCGKSSLLEELSVLPPDKADMLPGGYKIIEVEHLGEIYTLRSDYKKSGKHSFIHHGSDGDKELNDGGTLTAQKMIIEKIFGLTPELLMIWSGRTKFTQLSPTKRRDWILKLSKNDIDFAMKVYNLAKTETRDRQGVEKYFVKRLAEETAEVADQQRVITLTDQVEETTTLLNQLLESKDNRLPSVSHVKIEIEQLMREFVDCTTEALTTHLIKPRFLTNVTTLNELETQLGTYRGKLEHSQESLQRLYQQKDNVKVAVATLKENGVGEVDDLIKITTDLENELLSLKKDCPIYDTITHSQIPSMLEVYQSVIPTFLEALSELTDNSEEYFTTDKQKQATQTHTRLSNYAAAQQDQIRQYEHAIKHYNSLGDTECPECKHRFKAGMTQFDLPTTEKLLVEARLNLDKAMGKIAKCDEYLGAFNVYLQERQRVKLIMTSNPLLNPLWKLLVSEGLYKVAPTSHNPTIQQFGIQLNSCLAIHELSEKVTMNRTVLKRVGDATADHQQLNNQYLDQIDHDIHVLLSNIERTHQEMKQTHRFKQEVENNYRLVVRAHEIQEQLNQKAKLLVQADLNAQLGFVIQDRQVQLATLSSTLNGINQRDAVIKDTIAQKEKATEDYQLHDIVMKELSPVDGLISEYIQSFLNDFIESVNLVIDEIWSYDMEVLPCGVDSTDVTCKFPLSINQGAKVSGDIAESSDGQTDIINFAFRMAVAEYLDLYDYPLYLDELAPTFDEQHRQNLIRYLNTLIEDGVYNQMFMVSHYASNHYAFANAEILMLDDRNIVKRPGVFNQHAKLTYKGLDKEVA